MISLEQQKLERIANASAQQRQASDPKVSVWVEASAGTGKTKVLSDRVLRLLLSGINPARILCLTYTKAAAMRTNRRFFAVFGAVSVAGLAGFGRCQSNFFFQPAESFFQRYRQVIAHILPPLGIALPAAAASAHKLGKNL